MTKISELQEFTEKDLENLSTEELFELKRKHDKWWKEALDRVNGLGKPKDKHNE